MQDLHLNSLIPPSSAFFVLPITYFHPFHAIYTYRARVVAKSLTRPRIANSLFIFMQGQESTEVKIREYEHALELPRTYRDIQQLVMSQSNEYNLDVMTIDILLLHSLEKMTSLKALAAHYLQKSKVFLYCY